MTVKELKEYLADKDDNADVWFQDLDSDNIIYDLSKFNFLLGGESK